MIKRLIIGISTFFESPFSVDELVAGRYKVVEHLGAGGYGHSYLVLDMETDKQKVLKALRLHKRKTKAGIKGFELEKHLLLSIDHPGFPRYYEDGIYKNIPFFTMEYIQGKNFEQLIFAEGWKITEVKAFTIAYKLMEQIEYLHARNIIHRDIRIPNVLMEGSTIRLIDLGLARPRHYKEWGAKGSEIRKEINYQADFYGLGHFLLFLLYSNHSFPEKMQEKSWEEELDISNRAKHILRRLLQIEPAYDNSQQVKTDIEKMIQFLGGEANVVL
ncbi:protein kinase domain-containing protein [Neobacillus niacini]|uniref:serine/threonine protein kinase n=1 Tax=Neobacillus niacini TaxID=86668 RepID=UPI0021CB50B2|nr:protein kinase [Neobacillus niacini]MCM3767901.1 protein kinase [Neobacillus niacini]